MKAFIPSAGFGTRMGDLTKDCPKPLLPMHGVPLILYSLFLLSLWEIDAAVINLHYHGEKIKEYLKHFSLFPIFYSEETQLLGTAGGIRNTIPSFFSLDDSIIILNPDTILEPEPADHPNPNDLQGADSLLFLKQHDPYTKAKGWRSFSFLTPNSDPKAETLIQMSSADSGSVSATAQLASYYYIGYSILNLKFLAFLPPRKHVDLANCWYHSSREKRLRGKLFQGKSWDSGTESSYKDIQKKEFLLRSYEKRWMSFLERCGISNFTTHLDYGQERGA